jgi:flagellar hook-associated protein 1 FlgK
MSGLFSTLNASVQALNAQSQAIAITGKNLANVNNTSYARQRVIFGSRGEIQTPQGTESLGLEALGVQQLRDNLLDQQVVRQIADTSAATTEQLALQRAQAGMGETISSASATGSTSSSGGIGASIDNFFNAFQSLAAQPTDPGQRQALLQNASILVDNFQQINGNLTQVQSDLTSQIQGDVSTANTLLQSVADLNNQIGRAEIGNPGSAVDLRDQRQAKIEQLAAYLPIQTQAGSNGMTQVFMKDPSGANVTLVNGASVTGPVTFTGTGFTGGAGPSTLAFSTGSLAGELSVRDGAVQTLRNNVDALAGQIVTSVNAAYNPSATSGGNFFVATGTTAGTIALTSGLTATSLQAGTGASGDNSIALAVAAIPNHVFSTTGSPPDLIDGTLDNFYSSTASNLGQSLSAADTNVTEQTSMQQLVTGQRDSVSGVDLNEEMSNMVTYQRSFQASSRVFSIIDNLLDTVVNHLGV